MTEIFDSAFYKECGKIEGTLGSVPLPFPLASAHGAHEGISFTFGSTPELTTAPSWLIEGREHILADLALKKALQDQDPPCS